MRGGSEIPVEQTSTSDNPQPSGTVILVKARQLNESRGKIDEMPTVSLG